MKISSTIANGKVILFYKNKKKSLKISGIKSKADLEKKVSAFKKEVDSFPEALKSVRVWLGENQIDII